MSREKFCLHNLIFREWPTYQLGGGNWLREWQRRFAGGSRSF
jgi:hypothetical protein